MYGDGAIGGVVNIITKAPENKINYGSVGLKLVLGKLQERIKLWN